MTTPGIFERYSHPRAHSKARHFVVRDVPEDWIDDMGLPTHGMEPITQFIQREHGMVVQVSNGSGLAIIHFCYMHHSTPYSVTAEVIPGEGLVMAIASPYALARMTVDELKYSEVKVMAGKFNDPGRSEHRYRLVSDMVSDLPRWALFESTETMVIQRDPLRPERGEPVEDECAPEGFGNYHSAIIPRPGTVYAVIQHFSRALKPSRDRIRWGRLNTLRSIRTLLGEQGREFTPQAAFALMRPITHDDAVAYDELLDLLEMAPNDEGSLWQLIGKLGIYARTRLPEVYGERFMERWVSEVLIHQPDLGELKPSPGK